MEGWNVEEPTGSRCPMNIFRLAFLATNAFWYAIDWDDRERHISFTVYVGSV